MATHERGIPSEADVAAVEGQLATLYGSLPEGQRAVLETVIAAGLDRLDTAGDDTGGYVFDADTIFEARKLELRHAWAAADRLGPLGDPPRAERGSGTSVLEPVWALFRRATAAPATSRAVGESPA